METRVYQQQEYLYTIQLITAESSHYLRVEIGVKIKHAKRGTKIIGDRRKKSEFKGSFETFEDFRARRGGMERNGGKVG